VSAPVIEVRGYCYRVEDQEILSGVDLEVPAGRRLAVVGPNGAGKTTLLRALLGLVTASAGSIRIAGRPLPEWGRTELARLMSYVPQSDGGIIPFSVREFVTMGRYPHLSPFSPPGAEDRRAVERAMEITGTRRFADRMIGTLSGGERQEVMVAAALAQSARVLLLDEPTAFLDYRHQASIARMLSEISRETGATLISVTHDVNGALTWSDGVLALKDGRVAYHGSPEGLMSGDNLERLYGTRFTRLEHGASGRSFVFPEAER
jgi:iron complex transport system ATP-binding protein